MEAISSAQSAKSASHVRPISFRRNAAANFIGFLLPLAISFFMAPFLIRTLGDSRYGAWALLAELTGYYGMLDLGVRGAVGYYVARCTASQNWSELNRIVNLAFWFLSGAGVLILLIGAVFAWHIPSLFRIGDTDPTDMRIAALVMACAVGINLPISIFSAFLNGWRRLDLIAATELPGRVAITVVMVVLLHLGYGLLAMSIAQTAGIMVIGALQFALVRRGLSGLRIWPVERDWDTFKDLFKVAGANTAFNALTRIINQVHPIVIGAYLSTAWLAYFVPPRSIVTYYHLLIASITLSATTTFTHLHSSGNEAGLKQLYFSVARVTGILSVFLAMSILVFGESFIGLWIGRRFVTGDPAYRSDIVLMVMLVGTLPRTFQNISSQLLLATRRLGFYTKLRAFEAAASVVGAILLVKPLGIAGVALGTAAPMFISHIILGPYTGRAFRISAREYWQKIIWPSVIVNVWPALAALLLAFAVPPLSWRALFFDAALTSLVAAVSCWMLGMAPEEKRQVIAQARQVLVWSRLLPRPS
jgi:O-antigen/teichoic acid export membrane protein